LCRIPETQFLPTQLSIQEWTNKEAIGMLVGLVVFGAVISGAILIAVIVVL